MSTRPRRSVSRRSSPPNRLDEASAKAKTAAKKHAAAVAKLINAHSEPSNMDLTCTVAGVTHRGGFKLNFAGVESLSGEWMDRIRHVCAQRGYRAKITFDTTTAAATLHAFPIPGTDSSWPKVFDALAHAHPMTLLFWSMFFFNATRHIVAAIYA